MKTFRTFFENVDNAQNWERGQKAHLASQPVSRIQKRKEAIRNIEAREKETEQWKERQKKNIENRMKEVEQDYTEFLARQKNKKK